MYRIRDQHGMRGGPALIFEEIRIDGKWVKGPLIVNESGNLFSECLVFGLEPVDDSPIIEESYDSYRKARAHVDRNDNKIRTAKAAVRGEIRLDLVTFKQAVSHGRSVLERRILKGTMPLTESGGYGVPREIVLPTSTIDFLGGKVACPSEPEAYLRILYGDFEEVEYTYVNAAAAETRSQADRGGSEKARGQAGRGGSESEPAPRPAVVVSKKPAAKPEMIPGRVVSTGYWRENAWAEKLKRSPVRGRPGEKEKRSSGENRVSG